MRPGVERRIFTGEGATLALHRLMPGHEPRPHSHVHEQIHVHERIVLILAGTIRFHVNGEDHLVGPDGLRAIPPDAEHWGEVRATSRC
ncbi:AraC family ligand binding domain-containing protein [Azospirillum sp. HJ39]|uniref:AraC family ligand binding domain-containing protein n=1 Tax=Azospirillum sp. HJ39 TaxID=3159496 RepID=UPI003558DC78